MDFPPLEKKKSRIVKLLTPLAAGILAVLAYPYCGSLTPLIFVSFSILLVAVSESRGVWLLGQAFLFSLTFNLGTTYWLLFYEPKVSAWAIIIATLCMSLAIFLTQSTVSFFRKTNMAYFLWIPFWTSYEYLIHRWDLAMPLLALGNFFSIRTSWVQWYEYTGILGGSIWVLAVNIIIFLTIRRICASPPRSRAGISGMLVLRIALLLALPYWISISLMTQAEKPNGHIKVAVVQPNIDPFKEKFAHTSDAIHQMDKIFSLVPTNVDLDLIIGPETALTRGYFIHEGLGYKPLRYLFDRLQDHAGANLLIGAFTGEIVTEKSPASKPLDEIRFVESYNSALFLTSTGQCYYEHKSKLLPWAEQIPFIGVLPVLEEIALNSGFTEGSLTPNMSPDIFYGGGYCFASGICVEGIYGEYMAEKVRQGAQFLVIITSDGWWGESIIVDQLSALSRLRAIETRRWVARSANTGISSIVDSYGRVIENAPCGTAQVLVATLPLFNLETFYTRHGDYLGYVSLIISLVVLFAATATAVTRKYGKQNRNDKMAS